MTQNNDIFLTHSFAKINLGLFIRERLPNGYHDIETGFVFINWSDRIEVQFADKTTIECNDPTIPTGKDNLIIKAIQAFGAYHGLQYYYRIRLDKNIPAGAGLGGGSSNAGAILRILNKMHNTNTPIDVLANIGSAIGADVPLFVHAKTAIGTGTGTSLEYAEIQPDYHIVTVWPGIHSNTAEAYQYCEPFGAPASPLRELLLEPAEEWNYTLRNDLQPPVMAMYPEVGDMRDQFIDSGALYAAMSGSGSAVFGIFDQEIAAIDTYNLMVESGYKACLTSPGFNPDHKVYIKS